MSVRLHARSIWDAAVSAAQPADLVRKAVVDPSLPIRAALAAARRILVVGAGKAGAAMALGAEAGLGELLERTEGLVNVPASAASATPGPTRIHLHSARPDGSNSPTADGVLGSRRILELLAHAGRDDVALCLLSGGGSALLPAPANGILLEDKQAVTTLLHQCGATINEMNCVRKHLSAVKGGRLAQAFSGRALFSLIVSDVIGDPLDVIASGPTAADPTTFSDALAVFNRYHLHAKVPASVLNHLKAGASGKIPETLKVLPAQVSNFVLGNNAHSLAAATRTAEALGYSVINLGSFLDGETKVVAEVFAGIIRSIQVDGVPCRVPCCLLSGGETTVTLAEGHGLGGRNQEFVLALALRLGEAGLHNAVVLSGGTDGEDGPTDAAGAMADRQTLLTARQLGLSPADFLARNDAYHFFEATGDLLKTGLTGTNVMDVRVLLLRG